jgi:hypothetical protein
MRFIIRTVFWLTLIFLLLPSDPESGPDAPRVSLMDALDAVRGTITDLSQFCDRNPDLCTTGGEIVQVVADKARYGLDQIQGLLDNGGVAENTLTADDTTIPWQGEDLPIVATAD